MANCVFKTRLSKDILLVHYIHRKTWNFHRRKIVWNRPVEIASLTPWYSRFPRICLHSEAFRKVLNIFTFSISGQLVPVFCVDLAVFFVFFFSLSNIWVVEVHHENQCLWSWIYFQLSVEDLTKFLLLIRWPVVNTHNCVTHIRLVP